MPRYVSLKSLLVETIIFFALIILVAQLSVNFWERYMIQSELSQMKCSLYSMKETVTFIGKAYNSLYGEIKELSRLAESKQSPSDSVKTFDKLKYNNLDRRKIGDLNIQALIKEMHDTQVGKKDYVNKTADMKNDKMTWLDKNASTITRFPLQSTGTGPRVNSIDNECQHRKGKIHRCNDRNNNYAYPFQYWKF